MSELYELPKGWEWKKLDDFTSIKGGKRIPKGNKLLETKTNYPYIRVTDFNDSGSVDINNIQYITKDIYDEIKNYTISKNDIYISIAGTIGKTGIIPNELDGANLTENAAKIVFDNFKYDKYFLLYFTYSIPFLEQIGLATKIVAMPKLALTRLKEVYIPLPPLEEQKRIVTKLDILFAKIDKAIALHQKNIDEADIFMASVLNDVFVELEEKYGKQLLLDGVYIGCKKGFKPTIINGKVPFIGMSDIDEHNGINTKYVMEDYGNVSNGKTKFEKNAVLVGKITPCTQNNKTTIVPSNIDGGFATTEVYALHSMSNMNPYYLNHFMRSKEVNEFLVSTMVGATGRQRVPSESIKNLQISIPPLQTQQKVVSYLDEISNKIEKIKQIQKEKMQSLKELKASILDKAFKGEL